MRISLLSVTAVIAAALVASAHEQTPKPNDTIVGVWTLNKSASDLGATTDGRGDGAEGADGRRGDGGGRRRGGGGFGGGGFGRGGATSGDQQQNREAAQRMRQVCIDRRRVITARARRAKN